MLYILRIIRYDLNVNSKLQFSTLQNYTLFLCLQINCNKNKSKMKRHKDTYYLLVRHVTLKIYLYKLETNVVYHRYMFVLLQLLAKLAEGASLIYLFLYHRKLNCN